jgi:hypothetical protein
MNKTEALKKSAAKYVAPIDEAELAVRLAEAMNQIKRPLGSTARQALETMEDESREAWRRGARAAMEYWCECIANANTVS